MNYAATLTKTGQITVPKWVREALGVEPGQRIVFRKEKDAVRVERERTVDEITEKIHAMIPEEIRQEYIRDYGGLTAEEAKMKWAESPEGRAYFEEELRRCL